MSKAKRNLLNKAKELKMRYENGIITEAEFIDRKRELIRIMVRLGYTVPDWLLYNDVAIRGERKIINIFKKLF